jgi:glycosyltransferase involved in cell wall biosynthesis
MKVAMIDPSAFSPPYDHHLCNALSVSGCEITLLSTDFDYIGWNQDISYVKEEFFYGFTNKWLPETLPARFQKAMKGCEHVYDSMQLLRELERIDPDVIHFQWLALPIIDQFFINRLRRIAPLVHTVHESTPYHGTEGSLIQRIGAESIPRKFDHLIVHTENAKDDLTNRRISPSKISIIPHGILEYPVDNTKSSPEYSPRNDTVLLLFGGLKEYKGIDVLLKAFSQLSSDVQNDTQLKIAGSASVSIEELQSLASDLGISSHVDWDIRYIPDGELPELLQEADIFTFPYRTANQSGALMTALPYGKPIVASNVGGFSKVLDDEVHGRLVKPGDPTKLACALEEVLTWESKRENMGDAVQDLAENMYSWQRIAKKTLEVYMKVV